MSIKVLQAKKGVPTKLEINPAQITDSWIITGSYLHHNKNVRSTITKNIDFLEENEYYKFSFEVYDFIDCFLKVYVGNEHIDTITSSGQKTYHVLIKNTDYKKISFEADGNVKIRNISFQKRVYKKKFLEFSNPDVFENKSWTKSYSFYNNGFWVGYHPYLPGAYFNNQKSFFSIRRGFSDIWKHNQEGSYRTFYGKKYDMIIEYVVQNNPTMYSTLESISIHTLARIYDEATKHFNNDPLTTFDSVLVYNSTQSTGEKSIIVKQETEEEVSWMEHQTKDLLGAVQISRNESSWSLNNFTNGVNRYDKPLFSSDWDSIKTDYFIDKVPNSEVFGTKPWWEMERLRDRYAIVRLKFAGNQNTNLIMFFSINDSKPSSR